MQGLCAGGLARVRGAMQRHKRVYARLRRAMALREASVGRNKRSALRRRRRHVTGWRNALRLLRPTGCAASGAHGFVIAGEKIFRIPYPRPPNLAYPARVLSGEGPLSRSDPSLDRARAGRTGAPRNGRRPGGRWSAGRRCALPWARAVSPCRARWAHHPPPRVPVGALAPPTAPSLARFARDWQTSDALRRENERVWLFEI